MVGVMEGAYQMDGWSDGRIAQVLLVGGERGVRDGPAQAAALHLLVQLPAAAHAVHADAPVPLEGPCTAMGSDGTRLGSFP